MRSQNTSENSSNSPDNPFTALINNDETFFGVLKQFAAFLISVKNNNKIAGTVLENIKTKYAAFLRGERDSKKINILLGQLDVVKLHGTMMIEAIQENITNNDRNGNEERKILNTSGAEFFSSEYDRLQNNIEEKLNGAGTLENIFRGRDVFSDYMDSRHADIVNELMRLNEELDNYNHFKLAIFNLILKNVADKKEERDIKLIEEYFGNIESILKKFQSLPLAASKDFFQKNSNNDKIINVGLDFIEKEGKVIEFFKDHQLELMECIEKYETANDAFLKLRIFIKLVNLISLSYTDFVSMPAALSDYDDYKEKLNKIILNFIEQVKSSELKVFEKLYLLYSMLSLLQRRDYFINQLYSMLEENNQISAQNNEHFIDALNQYKQEIIEHLLPSEFLEIQIRIDTDHNLYNLNIESIMNMLKDISVSLYEKGIDLINKNYENDRKILFKNAMYFLIAIQNLYAKNNEADFDIVEIRKLKDKIQYDVINGELIRITEFFNDKEEKLNNAEIILKDVKKLKTFYKLIYSFIMLNNLSNADEVYAAKVVPILEKIIDLSKQNNSFNTPRIKEIINEGEALSKSIAVLQNAIEYKAFDAYSLDENTLGEALASLWHLLTVLDIKENIYKKDNYLKDYGNDSDFLISIHLEKQKIVSIINLYSAFLYDQFEDTVKLEESFFLLKKYMDHIDNVLFILNQIGKFDLQHPFSHTFYKVLNFFNILLPNVVNQYFELYRNSIEKNNSEPYKKTVAESLSIMKANISSDNRILSGVVNGLQSQAFHFENEDKQLALLYFKSLSFLLQDRPGEEYENILTRCNDNIQNLSSQSSVVGQNPYSTFQSSSEQKKNNPASPLTPTSKKP